MRFRSTMIAVCLAATGFVSPALAAPFGLDSVENLTPVAETEIRRTDTGRPMTLCHLTTTSELQGVPVWLSSKGYVLSENSCLGQRYFDMPEAISAGFANGDISADIPPSPQLSPIERLRGQGPVAFAALFLSFILLKLIFRRRTPRIVQRQEVLGLSNGPVFRFIDVMLHAANADGAPKPEEIAYIRAKATELTQLEYSDDHIAWAIERTEKLRSPRDFAIFSHGLTPDQSKVVLRAALAVVAADGKMSRDERRFISQLTTSLALNPKEIEKVMQAEGALLPA